MTTPQRNEGLKSRQNFIAREFLLLSFFIIVTFFLFTGYLVYKTYTHHKLLVEYELESQTNRIENSFISILDYTKFLMSYLNTQIQGKHSIQAINSLLVSLPTYNNDIYSYSILGWIDTNNKLVVSNTKGILAQPIDMSNREYLTNTRINPDKIYTIHSVYGAVSHILSIPLAMGVTDAKKRYIGTLVTGLPITFLQKKLANVVSTSAINFAVFDQDYTILFHSKNFFSDFSLNYSTELSHKIEQERIKTGLLSSSSLFGKGVSSYYKVLRNYPYIIVATFDQNIEQLTYTKAMINLCLQSLVIAIVIILSLYMVRRTFVSPIKILSEAADKIAVGKTDIVIADMPNVPYEAKNLRSQLVRVIAYTNQERIIKEELSNTKNALEQANYHILQANERLESKVYERTVALEKTVQFKTDFLNNMSHEVRTPIQSITGVSRALVEQWYNLSEERRYELSQEIAKNSNRLFYLVTDILDASKFNINKIQLDLKPSNILEIVQEVYSECRPLYLGKKDLQITIEAEENLPSIICDPGRIAQVIRNLLSNSVKFTSKGTINIYIKKTDITHENMQIIEGIYFEIKDEGIGIPQGELTNIFTPFNQSSLTHMKTGSFGLGLSICKKIIHAHNGRIWAEHNLPQGARFKFSLPSNPNIGLVKNAYSTSIPGKTANVLIIDDEDACLTSVSLMLYGTNYHAVTAEGGHSGLDYLLHNQENVNLILLDLTMPDLSGIQVLAEIQKHEKLRKIPVILLSGICEVTEIREALSMGAITYLSKPCTKEQLLEIIHDILYGNSQTSEAIRRAASLLYIT